MQMQPAINSGYTNNIVLCALALCHYISFNTMKLHFAVTCFDKAGQLSLEATWNSHETYSRLQICVFTFPLKNIRQQHNNWLTFQQI